MTKNIILSIYCLLFNISLTVAQKPNDKITGRWKSPELNITLEIRLDRDTYSAKIVSSNITSDIGKIVIWGLRYNDNKKEWADGYIKLPNMSHKADCYVKFNDSDILEITGYHSLRIFGISQHLYRINL